MHCFNAIEVFGQILCIAVVESRFWGRFCAVMLCNGGGGTDLCTGAMQSKSCGFRRDSVYSCYGIEVLGHTFCAMAVCLMVQGIKGA